MPVINAGTSAAATIAADQTVLMVVGANSIARFDFIASNASGFSKDGGVGRTVGPLATSQTFGPFGVAGTLTVYCDQGSLDYTINSTPISGSITATSYTQTAGAFSATGTGNKTLTASGAGTVAVGATGTGTTTLTRVNSLTVLSTDSSGAPGNATINNLSGRAAFPSGGSGVVVTNSLVTLASKVFVSLAATDATLTSVRVNPGTGSFNVVGNASATGITVFDFLVVN